MLASEKLIRSAGGVIRAPEGVIRAGQDIQPYSGWGGGQKSPPYQFFLCIFYKRRN